MESVPEFAGQVQLELLIKKAVVDFNRCICCTICMRTCPRGAIKIVPYSFPILQREEEEDLDEIKVQLKGIGTQLEEMERSIKEL